MKPASSGTAAGLAETDANLNLERLDGPVPIWTIDYLSARQRRPQLNPVVGRRV